MNTPLIILDHLRSISIDTKNPPLENYQALKSNHFGLKMLADGVRQLECEYAQKDPYAEHVVMHVTSRVPDYLPCAFNWFAVTLVNYLRFIALVEVMSINGWKSAALANPANRETIRKHCTQFVLDAAPEVLRWRNKVAAHFAATDPFRDDNLGTLEQSIMNPITYKYPHYYVGLLLWRTAGQTSELPTWALTKIYEDLRSRFWPEMHLRPVSKTAA